MIFGPFDFNMEHRGVAVPSESSSHTAAIGDALGPKVRYVRRGGSPNHNTAYKLTKYCKL